jgi:hypothetical protein
MIQHILNEEAFKVIMIQLLIYGTFRFHYNLRLNSVFPYNSCAYADDVGTR